MPETKSEEKTQYERVSISVDLLKEIERVVNFKKIGYRSQSEFIHEAIRLQLRAIFSLYPELKLNSSKTKE